MKICSVTITPNEDAVREAEETVRPFVDKCIRTIYYSPIIDFSLARNLALQNAADEGYDWALMLDTDERIHKTRGSLHNALVGESHDMLHVWADDHSYAKPRLFRLPARGHYTGPTHECWVSDPGSTTGTLDGITFSELPKTEAQYRAKAERDREILEQYTQEHPGDPRWFYYLGDTYSGLGDDLRAVNAFWECWELNGWDEESAWAAYRIAEINCKIGNYDDALGWCTRGMSRHPGMAELPWLAGYCCFKMGRFQHAIWWEEMAIALNKAKAADHRINFRHEPALWEGPYDVMSHASAALGRDVKSSADRVLCEAYMAERLKSQKSRAT